jgi:hypothetical protein
MHRCVIAACVPLLGLLLLVAGGGCVEEERTRLVSPNIPTTASSSESFASSFFTRPPQAPATEKTAKHVIAVGQKIVLDNPQMGLRPMFLTTGVPQPEIFHKGIGGLNGCQVVVSEGLVQRCRTDGQLAAVLCNELGKVIAEREAQATPEQRQGSPSLPPDTAVGNDVGGTFGPSDGTRRMELARIEQLRCKSNTVLPMPSPGLLAEQYLKRAGFSAGELAQVQPLLAEADKNCIAEKAWRTAVVIPPAAPAKPPEASP